MCSCHTSNDLPEPPAFAYAPGYSENSSLIYCAPTEYIECVMNISTEASPCISITIVVWHIHG
ncbi:DEHA2B11704p [Debaryomyces hansenii CBS767]|uniref:DEHA2B11704p n=1 Tax=Debaryomyces hansenii (strain ATCC 36239 / CBS 767 / BCRC 21394 / JCM 1990 / NBRC 0083 / IGC 2968) TaxID=284592 RepID=Q6BWF7_DEBHA|nr:DEHA2B11704p [Debaryomyces hansenii CBS767]CAG85466.1 DEHA2B11704p [Debaryomyces hansenii CBS767]|eukprot:XP_457462.1 DEHA2B11704p [Debaryomyces hansenii CBS767]